MNDAIRVGRISSIDYETGCADVCFKGEEDVIYTDLPFLAFEYKMPKVNDLVLVVAQKYAQKKSGFIIGPYFNDENKPEVSGKDYFFKRFSDTAYIKYDAKKDEIEIIAGKVGMKNLVVENIEVKNLTAEKAKITNATIDSATITNLSTAY